MRALIVAMLVFASGCFSVCQFDREEEARNRRMWIMEPEHILDPVAFHASDQPEGLDPPGPRPWFSPRRDPDIQPRMSPTTHVPTDLSEDQWEVYKREHREER